MSEKIGIAIGTPAQDMCHTFYCSSVVNMAASTAIGLREDVELSYIVSSGTLICDQRTLIAKKAIEKNCAWVLFIDSDMKFPVDTLVRMLKHEAPIVACNYTTRRPPAEPVAFKSVKSGEKLWTVEESTGLEECAAVGMGLMLVHTDVFKSMEKPWFYIPYVPDEDGNWGEDVWFCNQARKAGFPVMIDHDLSKEIRHIGCRDYDYLDALAMKDEVQKLWRKESQRKGKILADVA